MVPCMLERQVTLSTVAFCAYLEGPGRKLVLHTTALNLGLTEVDAGNMPSLTDTLLPMQGSAWMRGSRAAQRKLTTLLLNPPPRSTAEHIHEAIRCVLLQDQHTTLKSSLCSMWQLHSIVSVGK
jgi:hypothetical protein